MKGCRAAVTVHLAITKLVSNASERNCGLIGWTKGNRGGVESAQHVAALFENDRIV
jgi:hypothetical protein